jgi:ketosteroid isomerase-like protein
MSRENVEIVRRSFEAFSRKDLDTVIEAWAEESEWRPAMAGAVEGTVYRGRDGMRRYLEELFATFADVSPQDAEFTDLGDRVLLLYRLTARGRDSDVVVDQPGAIVYDFRQGQIVSAQSYLSWDDARAAAASPET